LRREWLPSRRSSVTEDSRPSRIEIPVRSRPPTLTSLSSHLSRVTDWSQDSAAAWMAGAAAIGRWAIMTALGSTASTVCGGS
jgi:hypothetical protein